MLQSEMLFSRHTDGAKPVRVLTDGWEILDSSGTKPEKYTTAKGLLAALTGHPEGRHWSLDRYFRIGRYAPDAPLLGGQGDILDLPPIVITSPEITLPRENPESAIRRKNLGRESGGITILRRDSGIDLARRAHEVRKLLFAGFGRRMFQAGYDPEDVLQEVYKGLLVRNQGRCAWDPAKSSFGHYVHMVCSCVLSNYHRKQNRIHEMEQLGLPSPTDDDGTRWGDVASNTTIPAPLTFAAEEHDLLEAAEDLAAYMRQGCGSTPETRLATRMVPHLLQGSSREHMAASLGVSKVAISKATTTLRTQARHWHKT